ncbi:MAG: SDR family NAD(P)-dependent oxidoreductase, partial [Pseudomonadota bacterium]
RGPSVSVQTACSTSLVAVHLACQSLLSGESDMALAGAATVRCPHHQGYLAREGDILSSDGHCRAFDAAADGTIFGSGVGAVLLKPLDKAIADGDHMYAVIKATAINNDGNNKVSYTASSVDGQAKAMVEAMTLAKVKPANIAFVECHGTGTIVGDPLEVNALTQAFRLLDDQQLQHCAIGSVKTNIGHLEQTAGMASLIKTALAISHGQIPASLNYQQANPKIPFADSPFYVCQHTQAWPLMDGAGQTRQACVNSLGLGGTNAFAVLEQAPEPTPVNKASADPFTILSLSARSEAALQAMAKQYADLLQSKPTMALSTFCEALNRGRADFEWRAARVVNSDQQLSEWLRSIGDNRAYRQLRRGESPKVAFLFSGQGSQYAHMAHGLYRADAGFRQHIDHCAEHAQALLGEDLRDSLFHRTDHTIDQTGFTQPALFVIETGLDRLWRRWGIEPAIVMGHSVGEYAAAVSAGIMSLEDGLRLICQRATLMQSLPAGGTMAAVFADEATVTNLLQAHNPNTISIAGFNGPLNTVIAGTQEAVDAVLNACQQQHIDTRPLTVSHGFHSPLMDSILDDFEHCAAALHYRAPTIGFVANIDGRIKTDAVSAHYWRQHARQPVHFVQSLQALTAAKVSCILEIGPGKTLINLARTALADDKLLFIPSLEKNSDDWKSFLQAVAQLYTHGARIQWPKQQYWQKLPLPVYPFQGKSYWFNTNTPKKTATTIARSLHPLLQRDELQRDELQRDELQRDKLQGAKAPGTWQQDAQGGQLQVNYGLQTLSYLHDHIIYDLPVLPLMAALEAITAAGQEYFGEAVSLHNIVYGDAIVLDPQSAIALNIVLRHQEDKRSEFNILGKNLDSADKFDRQHLWGFIQTAPAPKTGFDPQSIMSQAKAIDVARFYKQIRAVGLVYGERFRNIQTLWQVHSTTTPKALARLSLNQQLSPQDYGIHPALLDACLHIFPALVSDYGDFNHDLSGDSYLPVGMEQFAQYQSQVSDVWVKAECLEHTHRDLVINIHVVDNTGQTVAVMHKLALKRLARKALLPTTYLKHMYMPVWQALPAPASTAYTRAQTHWLILQDQQGIGESISTQLRSQGHRVISLTASQQLSIDHNDNWSIRVDKAEDYQGLCETYKTHCGQMPERIVCFWPCDQSIDNMGQTPGAAAVEPVLLLSQALIGNQAIMTNPPRLQLITRACMAVTNAVQLDPAASAVWGFGRTLAQEYPALRTGLIDLDHQSQHIDSDSLLQMLASDSEEDQIALRNQQWFGARLSPIESDTADMPDTPIIDKPVTFSSAGSYLITGGMGALGLQTAEWLISHQQVTEVILVGRGKPSAAAQAQIIALENRGANIHIIRGDISHSDGVDQILAEVNKRRLSLGGIIHAAGGLDDGVIAQMDLAQFRKVSTAKMSGAWYLHHKTKHLRLDCFILFSSVLSLTGSAGQCNYTAANGFLDSLGAYRQSLGLSATVINWGPWAETGLATQSGERGQRIWQRRGTDYLAPATAFDCMATQLARGIAQAAVTITDWSVYAAQLPAAAPYYQLLVTYNPSGHSVAADQFKQQLANADSAQQHDLLVSFMSTQVGTVLGLAQDQLSPDQSLQDLGLDSLMTVELLNRLNAALPVKVSMSRLLEGVSIHSLIDDLFPRVHTAANRTDAKPSGSPLEADTAKKNQWLVYTEARPQAQVQLICFAYAGGGPSVYRQWQQQLPDTIEVISI